MTKWKFCYTKEQAWKNYGDTAPSAVRAEASNVSKLSLKYHNITGAMHDDMFGLCRREGYTSEQYAEIHNALHTANPDLKLWVVVYTRELDSISWWQNFLPYIDVVNLWVSPATALSRLDEDLVRCQKLFPNKPINLGCYLRDYPTQSPVPMDLLRFQWERIPQYLDKGLINGYSILGTVLIDTQQEQAEWVRNFIAKH